MIKLMLVDDQPAMIAGLKALLSTHEDFSVVLTADSGEAAVKLLAAQQEATANAEAALPAFPDVVLMDIRMPGMGGVQATRQLKALFPQLTILILTTFDDDDFIIDALYFGASGYLLKDIGSKRLIEAVYEALSGNLLLTGRVAAKLASSIRQTNQRPLPHQPLLGFTEREREVARYIALGLDAREIGDKTALSVGTVKNYTSSIYAKIGINDRSKAILALRELLDV